MRAPEALRCRSQAAISETSCSLGVDAPVEALAAQHADLDLDHVQPAGVLGDIVELQPAQHPSRFAGGEGLVERAGRVRRQIVEHDPDALRPWESERQ